MLPSQKPLDLSEETLSKQTPPIQLEAGKGTDPSGIFCGLWARHESTLMRKCVGWMSGRIDEAEEALSRARLLAFRKYPAKVDEIKEPMAWFNRLTHNVCMDLHRELKRERARQVADSDMVEDASDLGWGCDSASPERRYLRDELETHLKTCVRELPPKLREAMELLFLEDCSYQEIAERLAISEVALRKRIQQARRHVRQGLAAYRSGTIRVRAQREAEDGHAAPAPRSRRPRGPWSRVKPVSVTHVEIEVAGCTKDLVLTLEQPPKRVTARGIASLRKYVAKHPTGWKKRLELARLLRRFGSLQEAISHYKLVVERKPQHVAASVELAEMLQHLNRPEHAEAVYARAHRSAPRAATRFHLAGLLSWSQRRFHEATEALREASRLEPDNCGHPSALAQLCLEASRPLEALEASGAALAVEPDDPFVLMLDHQALLAADRPLPAADRIRRSVACDSTNFLALSLLLDQRSRAEQVADSDSRQLMKRMLSLAPDSAVVQRSIARHHLACGAWEKGQQVLDDYVSSHPTQPRASLFYARVLRQIGRAKEAEQRIQEAYRLDPTDSEIRRAYCRSLMRSGQGRRARQAIAETLSLFPHDASVVRMAAEELAHLSGHETRVRELLSRLDRLQPAFSGTAFLRGHVLLRLSQIPESIDALEYGWGLLPQDGASPASVHAALALGRAWRQRREEARSRAWYSAALEHAEALRPVQPATAEAARGTALAALTHRADATRVLRGALEHALLYPERATVEAMLANLATISH